MASSSSSSLAPSSVRPMAWDASSPLTLQLLSKSDDNDGNNHNSTVRLSPFLSHDGVGCNAHERSALMQVLEDEDEEDDNFTAPTTSSSNTNLMMHRSRRYRKALCDCLVGWEQQQQQEQDDDDDLENLELLKAVYAVLHLSEIFLLQQQQLSEPGAVTARVVRWLRLHHMAPVMDDDYYYLEDEEHRWDGTSDEYWEVLRALVLRGCLEDAWALLSRHVLCRRCFETAREPSTLLDEQDERMREEDRQGFILLRALLLSAPLPGGRSDEWDEEFGMEDDGEEENRNREEDIKDRNDENREPDQWLLEGIPSDAYRLWDGNDVSRRRSNLSFDRPLGYNAHAARSTYRTWKRAVREHSMASLGSLKRRMPKLQTAVLDVLNGEFSSRAPRLEHWSDALCAELLYERPELRPQDVCHRARRVMEKTIMGGSSRLTSFDEVIVSVMQGNAGRAISTLHELGGGSGAALPATMTSLLCNLLTEAGLLPKTEPHSTSIQTELLLAASEAILSSLADESDLAVRLSTKLLLPYATPEADVRITATLAETLARYAPQTDAEARTLLSLCKPLVVRKSRRVLDGCVNLVLSRYRDSKDVSGGSVYWLLQGIMLELLLYCDGRKESASWETLLTSGVCGRILCMDCVSTSHSLLVGLIGDTSESFVGRDFARATEKVEAIENDSDLSDFSMRIPEVKLLVQVQKMAQAIVENQGDKVIASHLVACLEARKSETDGVVAPLAHPSMHWDFLLLAHLILVRDEERSEHGEAHERYSASFDVHGIQTLMECFTRITISRDGERTPPSSGSAPSSPVRRQDSPRNRPPRRKKHDPSTGVSPMRLALGKGLMRALVAENAKKRRPTMATATTQKGQGALSSKLSSYSRADQERIVATMLEPSM